MEKEKFSDFSEEEIAAAIAAVLTYISGPPTRPQEPVETSRKNVTQSNVWSLVGRMELMNKRVGRVK
jgi:hypothetical protein